MFVKIRDYGPMSRMSLCVLASALSPVIHRIRRVVTRSRFIFVYRCQQSTSLALLIYLICAAGHAGEAYVVRQQCSLLQQTLYSRCELPVAAAHGRRASSTTASHLFSDESPPQAFESRPFRTAFCTRQCSVAEAELKRLCVVYNT